MPITPDVCTFRSNMIEEGKYENVIVIDTFNFTTTAVYALSEGAESVVPLTDYENIPNSVTYVAGDSNEDHTNHPEHMIENDIEGEIVGLSTYNGSRAIHEVRSNIDYNNLALASLVNGTAVVNKFNIINENTLVVIAGSNGEKSPEDLYTSQYLFALSNSIDINLTTDFYEKQYKDTVLDSHDVNPGVYGNPDNHARDYVIPFSQFDIIPTYSNNGFVNIN